MNADTERRLFADGRLFIVGDWVASMEWIVHKDVDLPAEWMAWTIERAALAPVLERYVECAASGEAVEFSDPFPVSDNGEWNYQHAVGHEPASVNADARRFFEELTPGCEWVIAEARMRINDNTAEGPLFARIHPELGVRFAIAGCEDGIADQSLTAQAGATR
jgi:hypothetical protein